MTCPCCKEAARFVKYRPKTFISLLGEIRFGARLLSLQALPSGAFSMGQNPAAFARLADARRRGSARLFGSQESSAKPPIGAWKNWWDYGTANRRWSV